MPEFTINFIFHCSWSIKLFVMPSRLMMLTGAALLGTCGFIAGIVGILHWRDKVSHQREIVLQSLYLIQSELFVFIFSRLKLSFFAVSFTILTPHFSLLWLLYDCFIEAVIQSDFQVFIIHVFYFMALKIETNLIIVLYIRSFSGYWRLKLYFSIKIKISKLDADGHFKPRT